MLKLVGLFCLEPLNQLFESSVLNADLLLSHINSVL